MKLNIYTKLFGIMIRSSLFWVIVVCIILGQTVSIVPKRNLNIIVDFCGWKKVKSSALFNCVLVPCLWHHQQWGQCVSASELRVLYIRSDYCYLHRLPNLPVDRFWSCFAYWKYNWIWVSTILGMLLWQVESHAVVVIVFSDVFSMLTNTGVGTEPRLTSVNVATNHAGPRVIGSTSWVAGSLLRDGAPWMEATREIRCG